jgi:quercetin dioxygenase-like cupin family protein
MTGPPRAHHVAAGEGERLIFNGTERRLKLSGAGSAGQLTVYESFYPAGTPHPLHIHHDAIESFYILDGECKFRVGDDIITANKGSFLSVPRGATHGLMPIGGPARAPVFFVPAAMEGYWEEVAAATVAGTLDEARLDELNRQHNLEMVGP